MRLPLVVTIVRSPVPLDQLRAAVRDTPALPALSGDRYALTHAVFEAASSQRGLLQQWLATELPPMLTDHDPVRVVGVGVGDGTVDAPFAAALAEGGRRVRYTGVEPHAASAVGFVGRLAALDERLLTPTVVVGDFADSDRGHPADLVHFLHSLYYVEDLGAALDHAIGMLGPGGLLLAATAPLEPLCVLTELLCPWSNRQPWFSADVRAELDLRGLEVTALTLVGRLDMSAVLSDPLGRGEALLDFLVGACTAAMSSAVREETLDYLRGIALPDDPGGLPHPLDLTIARLPG